MSNLVVTADSLDLSLQERAEQLALALGCNYSSQPVSGELVLLLTTDGLALGEWGRREKPLRIDFTSGKSRHRRLHGGGEMIGRAIGVRPGFEPHVVDATAGLAQDGFVLASLGARVTMLERSPAVWALLNDALMRASADPALAPVIQRIQLIEGDAAVYLGSADFSRPDVVYLDPMFPERKKSAAVRKEMRLFQKLLAGEDDGSTLLEAALNRARYRVVVKRPLKAPCLGRAKPTHQLTGKAVRFDIYGLKALP